MKKVIAISLILLPILSTFAIFAPKVEALEISRPSLPDGPGHTNELVNLMEANTTEVLIVTEGYGPLTGISPQQDKDLWKSILSDFADVAVDWYDGVPTFTLLDQYDLVIYDAGGYWHPLSNSISPLRQYHFSGKPMIVVAPDINWDWGTGYLDPSFVRDVLHIEGVLGILPQSEYDVHAGTGHSLESGMPNDVHVPAQTSWPDCFDPASDAERALVQKYVVTTEFGVGTAAGLPEYSLYTPLDYYTVVAYPGSSLEGKVVTIGVPVAGLSESVSKQLCSNMIAWTLGELTGKQLLIQELNALNLQVDEALNNQLDLLAGINARIYMELELSGLEQTWDYVKIAVGLIAMVYTADQAVTRLDYLSTNAPKLFENVYPMYLLEIVTPVYLKVQKILEITDAVTDELDPGMGESAVKEAYKSGYYQEIELGSSTGLESYESGLDQLHEDLVSKFASMPEEDDSYVYMRSEVKRIREAMQASMDGETVIQYVDLESENLVGSSAIGGIADFYGELGKYFEAIDAERKVNDIGFALYVGGILLKTVGVAFLLPTAGASAAVIAAAEMAAPILWTVGSALQTGTVIAEDCTKEEISQLVGFRVYPLITSNLESYGEIYASTLYLIDNWEIKGDFAGECTQFELEQYTIPVDPTDMTQYDSVIAGSLFDTRVDGNVWLSSDQATKGGIVVQVFSQDGNQPLSIIGNTMDLDAAACTAIPFSAHLTDIMLSEEDEKLYRAVAYMSIGTNIVGEPLVQQFTVVREGTPSSMTTGSFSSSIGSGESYSEMITTDVGTDGFYVALDYPGSDLDLHLFDSQGNHIGMDYSTGIIEIQIPNGDYSGPDKNPEWISIEGNIGEETFTATVVGIYVEGQEPFALSFAISTPEPPDEIPPTTIMQIDSPNYTTLDAIYVTSSTPFTLIATDNPGGTGVASTGYCIYNDTYDSGWLTYSEPFYLTGLTKGPYSINYYSTDNAGNVEVTKTAIVILDNTGPSITVLNPPIGWALQDGVTFVGSAIDFGSGVFSLSFSIREANDGEGVPIGFEDLQASYDATTGEWSLFFDTLLLPDGYYVFYVKAVDNLGNIASTIVPYSIRNWAVIELLPASEDNKAGRTMPIKFALRVAASVDPSQPFVYNEELKIEIYAMDNPDEILQESTFGDTARAYRISSVLYVTNFKTLKRPMEYTVTIYRNTFDIDSFTFETVK